MEYDEFIWTIVPKNQIATDLLTDALGEVGFESFIDDETDMATRQIIHAFIQRNLVDVTAINQVVSDFLLPDTQLSYVRKQAEQKDWNAEWEKNFFTPLVIGNQCVVHSTFHKDVPASEHDIVINPQMAFGTGHHATTSMMLQHILELDLQGKQFIDMGCGTSILGILAMKCGAAHGVAIDIDTWCVDNSQENIALNEITDIDVKLGDASILSKESPVDLFMANINRNILVNEMAKFVQVIRPGGHLLMSGFYEEDQKIIQDEANRLGFRLESKKVQDNWCALHFILA